MNVTLVIVNIDGLFSEIKLVVVDADRHAEPHVVASPRDVVPLSDLHPGTGEVSEDMLIGKAARIVLDRDEGVHLDREGEEIPE